MSGFMEAVVALDDPRKRGACPERKAASRLITAGLFRGESKLILLEGSLWTETCGILEAIDNLCEDGPARW